MARHFRRILRLGFVAFGLSPWVVTFLSDRWVPGLLRSFYAFQCHGLTDRVVRLLGHPMPVCSRCLGIYLGLALSAALPLWRLRARALRIWLVVAAVLMTFDALLLEDRAPWSRLMTGLLLAFPAAKLILGDIRAPTEA